MNRKKTLAMTDILPVGVREITFAESKVIYRIEDIGLPRAVKADKAVYLVGKLHVNRFEVLEI